MDNVNVIPFTPGQRRPASRRLVAEQAREQQLRYARALTRQQEERMLRRQRPVPARITLALDVGGHEGPQVDTACGAAEPAVDLWECGVEVPTPEQLRLLAALTGYPVGYFFLPIATGPLFERMFICGPRGCTSPEPDYVDERGVLHYGGEPPRRPPTNAQAALF